MALMKKKGTVKKNKKIGYLDVEDEFEKSEEECQSEKSLPPIENDVSMSVRSDVTERTVETSIGSQVDAESVTGSGRTRRLASSHFMISPGHDLPKKKKK